MVEEHFTAHCSCHTQLQMICHSRVCALPILNGSYSPPPQPPRLRGSLDVCLEHLDTTTRRLDLLGGDSSQNVQSGCPTSHCLPQSSFTFAQNDSFLLFSAASETTDYLRVSLQLQTRCIINEGRFITVTN